ncbi:MAG: hypothetical protein Q7S83_02740 [bacterium]|nr:hypothetical protein [bacterium]
MSFSLVYLAHQFLYRIYEFLRHWYVGGFLTITHRTLAVLENLDQTLALWVTFKYIFRPLYQDYSVIGYVLGFIFRITRLFMGGLVYLIIVAVAMVIYLAWAGLPIYIAAKGLSLI